MGLHLSFSSPLLSPSSLLLFSLLFLPPYCLRTTLANPSKKTAGTPPPTSSHRALNLPQRHFLLFCRIVGVNLASSTRRSFHESSSLSFLIFAIPLEHLSPLIGFFVDESWNYFQRSWGFRAVQVSNDSARKGSDNCLVGSLLFLLSSSVPSGYTSIRFFLSIPLPHLSFLSFFYLMDAENEKQRGRNANCVFLFSYLPSCPQI